MFDTTRENSSTYAIKSVDNALAFLEALSESDGTVGITSLSRRLGLNKSNVFRLLTTFEQRGYIEKDKASGTYRVGLSAYEMGQKFLSRMDLLTAARPAMQRLGRQCNEAIYLAIPRRREVLMLDMVDAVQAVGLAPLVGNRYPLSACAAGRAIRSGKMHVDIGGLGVGTASLAAPLLDAEAKVLGSLCIAGPEFRLGPERIAGELLPALRKTGEEVSARFGYFGKLPLAKTPMEQ